MPRLTWQKSSYSGSGQDDCIEVTPHPATVGRATAPSWAAFLRAVKADRCAAGFR
nr:DUF397 domain-containing protein [Streptomyces rimosus]